MSVRLFALSASVAVTLSVLFVFGMTNAALLAFGAVAAFVVPFLLTLDLDA